MKIKLNENVDTGTQLIQYDSMCLAIAQCARVDEIKDLTDKATALQLYYKQCRNWEAERQATTIRIRAEVRTGQLLKELARVDVQERNPTGVGGRAGKIETFRGGTYQSPYTEALQSNGISKPAAFRFQALAAVPEHIVEAALLGTKKLVSGRQILESITEPKVTPMPGDTLWLWGRLRDLEREGFFDKDISELLKPMTPTMLADVHRLAPRVADFFNQLNEATHELA